MNWVLRLWIAAWLFCAVVLGQDTSLPKENENKVVSPNGPVEILSDTMGVNFGPYSKRMIHTIDQNWWKLIPQQVGASSMKKGKVSIEFTVLKDGKVECMNVVIPSGDILLDRAAMHGITALTPFPPLPSEFVGPYLALRLTFQYNPNKSDVFPNKTAPSQPGPSK